MTVDTRHQARVDLDIDVLIAYRKRCIRARSVNVSDSGMFLQVNSTTIPPGTYIGLEFVIDNTSWQIDGLVVRQDANGIGCLFRMAQPELISSALGMHRAAQTGTIEGRSALSERGN